jgi:hypothetical protein
MVNRTYFKCNSCETALACRTQIGHGREQTYLFPCPSCGVDLGFSLLIDQDELAFKYDDLLNLDGYAGETEPEHLFTFSSDFLVDKVPSVGSGQNPLTPFMANLELAYDSERYLMLRSVRRRVAEDFWPSLQRARTHLRKGDVSKFHAELLSIGGIDADSKICESDMPRVIAECTETFEALFRSDSRRERQLVEERIAEANKINPTDVEQLKAFYAAENHGEELYDELRNLDRQWVELYAFFGPLEIVDCTDDVQKLIDLYTLSEKPLARLKAFHSDCFESLGRLLNIAAAYEGICLGQGVGMPSKSRLIPLNELVNRANGTKAELMGSTPFWSIVDGCFDSKLRNGIGHNSWRYDAATDIIHYQNQSQSQGRQDFSIAYLDFCIRTRKLYHCVTFFAKYLHSVWV